MKTQSLSILIWIILLIACNDHNENKAKEALPPIPVAYETVVKSFNNCNPDDAECTYIKVVYPTVLDESLAGLNSFLDSIKSPAFDPEKLSWPLDSFANDFIKTYSAFRDEYPESATPWFINYVVELKSESDSMVTIISDLEEYTGGAHGNKAIFYHNLRRASGEKLALNDLYNTEEQALIGKMLSAAIDSTRVLFSPHFYPNNNFILSQDSITFLFNPYEIAPYSEGVIELTLPRDIKEASQGTNHVEVME